MSNELEVKDRNISPAQLIIETVQKTGNVTDLKELLAIQKDWEANEARKIYAKSFSLAQSAIQSVAKNKFNPQTRSKYADLAGVIESAQPIYTKEGFSVTFNEGECQKENHMRTYAYVLHSSGHKETYYLDMPLDGTGIKGNPNMTAIHGKASTSMYSRRYLMCMIWNIPTSDEDGNTQVLPKITDAQLHQLRDLLIVKELNEKKLLEYLKIENLEDLQADQFTKALTAINVAKKGGGK